ncbi:MAG: aspartate/glutamate racemase family protein [Hylemonella sp.]|nr:aspartate/glutamate racemase family protein [Hylemonella sp.]
MPPQLLIINPNTTVSVSQTLHEIALREAAQQCAVRVQTARLGASYISDEVSFAIAGHALLDAYAFDRAQPDRPRPDAVVIGCFGDPGLLALRQLCDAPVIGLAQASMQAAHARGRYAVITGGQAWVPMLQRLVMQLGLDDKLASIQAVDKTGAQLAADPQAAVRELADLCEQVLAQESALQTILLGGAALGGLAQPIQELLAERGIKQVQVMDSVASSLGIALTQARAFATQRGVNGGADTAPSLASMASPVATLGLSSELQMWLGGAKPH